MRGGTASAGLCALAALLVCHPSFARAEGPAISARVDPHHRSVDANTYPWSSVGKLFNSIGGACTAAVIAPDRVLTAAHCLYAFRTRRFLPPDAIHFLLGYDRGSYRLHARVLTYHLGPGYDPARERATASADWAVLDLADRLPADRRPLDLRMGPPAPGTAVALAGFAQDRAFVMTADTDCHVLGSVDGGLISHDCATQHGDSGAPVLTVDDKGVYGCVGVAVGLTGPVERQIGIAAPVSLAMRAAIAPGR